jgi:hypothetical protein
MKQAVGTNSSVQATSILSNLPSFNKTHFSKANPRSNHKHPAPYFCTAETAKPKWTITTEKISILHRFFEKLDRQQQQQQQSITNEYQCSQSAFESATITPNKIKRSFSDFSNNGIIDDYTPLSAVERPNKTPKLSGNGSTSTSYNGSSSSSSSSSK